MTESGQDARAERLWNVYKALRRHFGYHPAWWPGTPWDITWTAVLVQQCNWQAAWSALGRLTQAGFDNLHALAGADPENIEQLLAGVAFAPTKSRRIVSLAANLLAEGSDSLESLFRSSNPAGLRRWLLSQPGIGPETADAIQLYAAGQETFVIDAYTRRAAQRIGWPGLEPEFFAVNYEVLQRFFVELIDRRRDRYRRLSWESGIPWRVAACRDLHAQFVELGKHHCLKTAPLCRAVGRPGWKDYPVCAQHCRAAGTCRQCPLAGQCAAAPAGQLAGTAHPVSLE